MQPITPQEDLIALDRDLQTHRVELATIRNRLDIHRNVLRSPAKTIADLEDSAVKIVAVIEHLEAKRASILSPATGPTPGSAGAGIPLNE